MGGALLLIYLLPIMVVACFGGLGPGLFLAALAAVTWSVSDWIAAEGTGSAGRQLLDFGVRLAVFSLMAYLEASRERLLRRERTLSSRDPLTGAENPRAFAERIEVELRRLRRHGRPLTVVYLDVDDFKAVNDRWGHSVGDGLLCATAGVLRADVRATDVVARVGGDEFALLLPETGADEAKKVLDRILEDLGAISQKGGWGAGFSVGAVVCGTPEATAEALVHRADKAMYEAKSAGKDRVHMTVFDPKGEVSS
jgi:diguanylate cyclase (GGDEF)-like protein